MLLNPAPLLEKEGDRMVLTLALNLQNPFLIHRPRSGAGLTADNHPMNVPQ
jgi:hypothetical protein